MTKKKSLDLFLSWLYLILRSESNTMLVKCSLYDLRFPMELVELSLALYTFRTSSFTFAFFVWFSFPAPPRTDGTPPFHQSSPQKFTKPPPPSSPPSPVFTTKDPPLSNKNKKKVRETSSGNKAGYGYGCYTSVEDFPAHFLRPRGSRRRTPHVRPQERSRLN